MCHPTCEWISWSNDCFPSVDNPNNIRHGHKFFPILSFRIFVNIASQTVIIPRLLTGLSLSVSLSLIHTGVFTLHCSSISDLLLFCISRRRSSRFWCLESSLAERDPRDSARTVSLHPTAGTSTGLTNSVRQNETQNDQTYALVEPTPSVQQIIPPPIVRTTTHGMKEGESLMQRQSPAGISLAESQFYVRTSNLPDAKQRDIIDRKSDELYSSPPADDTYHDAIDDLSMPKDPMVFDKGKLSIPDRR